MKKVTAATVLLSVLILLFASGCGKQQSAPTNLDIKAVASAVIKSGAYTDSMSDKSTAAITLYKLDTADVAESDVYFSSMATAEECAIFKASSSDAAARILAACKDRQTSQVKSYENYVPTEVSKINSAIITQAGDYVFYIVSNDQTKVASVLSGYGVNVSTGK